MMRINHYILGVSVMDLFEQKLKQYKDNIQLDLEKRLNFIRQQVDGNGFNGVVIGISGGIDSALVAALCVKALGRDRVTGVWMPAYSQEVHAEDSKKLAEAINMELLTVDLGNPFDAMKEKLSEFISLSDLSLGNMKARLRMVTLYAIGNEKRYLVSDTCNRSEIHIGYFTKGGDGLADFNPVASLTKHEVRILSEYLGVPDSIINKAPSADLWAGQTDENEMGFTYEALDRFLLTGETDPQSLEKIQRLHRISEHKRNLMPGI